MFLNIETRTSDPHTFTDNVEKYSVDAFKVLRRATRLTFNHANTIIDVTELPRYGIVHEI